MMCNNRCGPWSLLFGLPHAGRCYLHLTTYKGRARITWPAIKLYLESIATQDLPALDPQFKNCTILIKHLTHPLHAHTNYDVADCLPTEHGA